MAGNDPKIEIDITARDKASETIDDVAKAAGDLEELTPEVSVTADTGAAVADIGTVEEAAGRLSKDDTVLVIKAQIDQAKGELDALQTKLHDIDTASTTTGQTIGTEIESGTSKAASATHSMAGNVLGDAAAMGTGVQALGEGFGQLTEGILAGEVGFKDLVTAGLGMGAIALISDTIQKHMAEIAAHKAFDTHRVEAFAKALQDGATAAAAWDKAFDPDTGKLEFFDAATGKVSNAAHALAAHGITWEEFKTHLNGGTEAFQNWAQASSTGIGAGDDLNAIIQTGTQLINEHTTALNNSADAYILSGNAAAETGREDAKLTAGLVKTTEAQDDTTTAVHTSVGVLDDAKVAVADLDESYRLLHDRLGKKRAIEDWQQAMIDAQTAIHDKSAETVVDIRGVEDAIITAGEAAKLNPVDIQTAIIKADQGDIDGAFLYMQQKIDEQGPLDVNVALHATVGKLKIAGRGGTSIVVETDAATMAAAGAASTVYNVSLPRGVRSTDISRALGVNVRRNGRRYGVRA